MNKVKLGDCIELIIDNRGKTPPLAKTGYELIETASINGSNKYPDYSKITKFVSEETYNTWFRKGHPTSGDILISTVGMNIGDVVIMKSNRGSIAQNLIALRTNNKLNSDYLYYILTSKNIREKIRSLNIGSAQPSLKVPHLLNIEFYLPNIEKQSEISKILNELDEKIEINTQINQTLEQIAQTIFKSWFIDFDPVHAKANALANGQTAEQATQAAMAVISGKNTQELHRLQTANPEQYQQLWEIADAFPSGVDESGVPWGWSIKYFKDITSLYIDNRGKTPPIEESGIPLLEVKHLPENSIFPNLKTEKYISDDTYDSWLRQKLEPLDVVISTVGTIGRISLIPFNKKVAIAQNILGFRFKQDITNQVFMFYQMKSHKFNFDVEARLVETVQKSIKRKDLETIPLIIPDLKLQTFFEKMVLPAILKQDNENETLENIRDQLLPKLLSGELNGLSEKTI